MSENQENIVVHEISDHESSSVIYVDTIEMDHNVNDGGILNENANNNASNGEHDSSSVIYVDTAWLSMGENTVDLATSYDRKNDGAVDIEFEKKNQEGDKNTTNTSVVSADDSRKSSQDESYLADESLTTSSESWSISSLPSYSEELKLLYKGVGSMELNSRVETNKDFDANRTH